MDVIHFRYPSSVRTGPCFDPHWGKDGVDSLPV